MTSPTGSLAIVERLMEQAREYERLMGECVEAGQWNIALSLKCEAEQYKQRAGIEFLLWFLYRVNMPPEPTAKEIEAEYEARKAAR